MRVYLAGPMRGVPDLNAETFADAAAAWRAQGFDVVNPHELDARDGFVSFETAMARDIRVLLNCDLVAVLPHWQESVGARIEVLVARATGKPVVHAGLPPIATQPPLESLLK